MPVYGVEIALDWKIETRIKLIEAANSMISNAYLIGTLDPAFPAVLGSIIEGKGLYEHGIGEFFPSIWKIRAKISNRKRVGNKSQDVGTSEGGTSGTLRPTRNEAKFANTRCLMRSGTFCRMWEKTPTHSTLREMTSARPLIYSNRGWPEIGPRFQKKGSRTILLPLGQ